MTSQADTSQVENPYVYWRTAQQYEAAGDLRGAEIGYKAAVLAADNLPLGDYRRDFQEELAKHLSIPGYKTEPNIGPAELKSAYAELLTLPFAARVKLADFFARQNSPTEAMEICQSAMSLPIDDWILSQPQYIELKQQLDTLVGGLQYGAPRASQTISKSGMGRQLLGKAQQEKPVAAPGAYINLPDITEMWNAHMSAGKTNPRINVLGNDSGGSALAVNARTIVDSLFMCLQQFVEDMPANERKRLSVLVNQPHSSEGNVTRVNQFGMQGAPVNRYRFHASTVLSSISVRASEELIEAFIVPTRDVLQLADAESDDSLRLRFQLQVTERGSCWTSDGYPVYADDLRVALRNLFKDVIAEASTFLGTGKAPSAVNENFGLAKRVSELSEQRTNLVEKVVYQQELVQNRIARDIHDSVIADLLALKRAYEAGTATPPHVVGALEAVAQRLRNICSDLAPRDLQDWGLRTVVTDMATSTGDRLNIQWAANVSNNMPELPHQVSLHVYRIIQECLNNVEKHSQASAFLVDVSYKNGILTACVEDDGIGFDVSAKDSRKAAQGGMGLDSIRERVELVRCFYPAQLWIQSKPGEGTKTTLQINLQSV